MLDSGPQLWYPIIGRDARPVAQNGMGVIVAAYSWIGAKNPAPTRNLAITVESQLEIQGGGQLEEHFDLDKEFDIVELESRSAASPDGQVIVVGGSGSGGSGGGSGSVGSGGSGGSGGVNVNVNVLGGGGSGGSGGSGGTIGSGGSGGGSGT
jgi:hypothetical protein